MQNLNVNLNGYRLRVVDDPEPKTRKNDDGEVVPATDPQGRPQWVISVHAKLAEPDDNGRKPKGEEIKVTVLTDPADIEDGDIVELVKPQVSPYHIQNNGRCSSGLSFKATAASKVGA